MSALRGGSATPGRWPVVGLVLAVGLPYSLGALVSFLVLDAGSTTVLFPPAGVTVAALILTVRGQWPVIVATIVTLEIVIDLSQGLPAATAVGLALANTVEPIVGASVFRMRYSGVNVTTRRGTIGFLLSCVLIGPLAGAAIGATVISSGLDRTWFATFVQFWAGDALAVLVIGGTILTWRHTTQGMSARSGLAYVSALAATAGVSVIAFRPADAPLVFLPIAMLMLLAFQWGPGAAASGGAVLALVANVMSAAGHGPWAAISALPRWEAATLQFFVAVSVVSAWALGAEAQERIDARADSLTEARARARATGLQQVTARLTVAATSDAVARVMVTGGIALVTDIGVVGIASGDGKTVEVWATEALPGWVEDQYRSLPVDADTPLSQVIRTGLPLVDNTVNALLARGPMVAETYVSSGIQSRLALPLTSKGKVLGALSFAFPYEGAIDAERMAVAEILADLAGQALGRAREYEGEYDAAHRMQQALLPEVATHVVGVTTYAAYRPAHVGQEVGGDWYDVIDLSDNRIGLTVGDVAGHDLEAAITMGRLTSALRVIADERDDPADVVMRLDRASRHIPGAVMTTLGYADFHPGTREFRYCVAGHLPPLLVTKDGVELLWEARGVPLGLGATGRQSARLVLPPDAVIVWYTDGVVERRDQGLTEGVERLRVVVDQIREEPMATWCPTILSTLNEGREPSDDAVLLCVKLHACPDAPPDTQLS